MSTTYSSAGKSIAFSNCYMSVKTPNTCAKSTYSKSLNRTVANWRTNNNPANKSEVYSAFSKGNLNRSDFDMQRDLVLE